MTKKIMIDPGHAPGNANRGPTGYYEFWGMWKLANYLKAALERCGIVADLTRKENENPSLQTRGEASKGYDLFISEHSNGANGQARGCEVYYSLRRKNDRQHAAAISAASANLMGNPNRGAKTRLYPNTSNLDYHGVIRYAESVGCPHIFLAENGFHDNAVDEAWLKDESNLELLAETHAKEICRILDVKYVAPIAAGHIHVVKPGETYWSLAQKYGVSVLDLESANSFPANAIPVGAKITIPGANIYFEHKIVQDDTFWGLSRRYGITVDSIQRANPGVNPNTLRIGSKIKIPKEEK